VWQKKYEEYGSDNFTIVGLALDAEGIAPAKLYYDRFGVTFPSLVDPDYATRFGAVPKTFLVDEHGVVLDAENWEETITQLGPIRHVSDEVRALWSPAGARLDAAALERLARESSASPRNLLLATQLASRYLALELHKEARAVLERAVGHYDAKAVARAGGKSAQLLGQAYFQLSRAYEGDRQHQVEYAEQSFFLQPTVGFGKQIARIIDPEKFDGRPQGDFDNQFREGTLRRLKQQRLEWLGND
jgi:hypothetical protein